MQLTNPVLRGVAGWLSAAFVTLALLAVPARADDAPVIVLESYAGPRPDDAGTLLQPLYAELGKRGYLADPGALSGRIHELVAEPGDELSSGRQVEAVELATAGQQHWLDGDTKGALRSFKAAMKLFHERPVTIARTPNLRDKVFDTLVGLALANRRVGDAEGSSGAMAELIRSFPDREVSNAKYGPEARRLYQKVAEELGEQGRGVLRVRCDDPAVTVFVDERYAGTGNLELGKLYPGTYRIYLQKGDRRGMVHRVTVTPGTESQLSVAWGFESSLRAGADFVGFVFASDEAKRAHSRGYAVTAAQKLGAGGVIVIGIEPYQGRRSVVAVVLSLSSSKPLRAGAVAIEPTAPSSEQMRALARFLAGDEPGPGVLVNDASSGGDTVDVRPPKTTDVVPSGHDRVWKWAALVAGVAAVGGGVTLIAADRPAQSDGSQNQYSRDTRLPGIAMTVGGAALIGVSAFLWRREVSESRGVASVHPIEHNGWAISWSGAF